MSMMAPVPTPAGQFVKHRVLSAIFGSHVRRSRTDSLLELAFECNLLQYDMQNPMLQHENKLFFIIIPVFILVFMSCTHEKARLMVAFRLSRACERERGTSDREARSA
ncbi:hypothetical protein EVAR_47102_1 [Eumeta japonica]|uniref:Uncharacterized protein n=1 Tax=Eumeta variegata TaxID=151549 RepID=A0A4C1YC20_EUMVA|nr:hypothetical protein EVAR_47102_1 [Eumeta japonica]